MNADLHLQVYSPHGRGGNARSFVVKALPGLQTEVLFVDRRSHFRNAIAIAHISPRPHKGVAKRVVVAQRIDRGAVSDAKDRNLLILEGLLNNSAFQFAIIDHKLNQYWQRSRLASDGNEALAIRCVASWCRAVNPIAPLRRDRG